MRHPLATALFPLLFHAVAAQAASVQQFMPQGRIDQQTRATALFSTAIAQLGETTAPAPFTVDCGTVKGEGRWVDPRTWAWQLAQPLAAGERCQFTLRPGLVAQNGEAVTGKGRFEFFAAGPWPRSILPRPGGAVDEEQAFVINGGGPIKPASAEKNIWCEADGVGNRIAVRLVPDAQRREILSHVHGNFGPAPLVVACAERLPPGAKMKLVWGKGVEAANGAKSEKEESFVFTVREPFLAKLSCEREKAGAPCSPLSAVTVELTAHVEAKLLQKIRLVTPDGTRSPKDPDRDSSRRENMARSVSFPGPYAAERRAAAGASRRHQGRRRPAARQRRQLPAQVSHRRPAAAGQVPRQLRHRRTQGRRAAAGDAAQRRSQSADRQPQAARQPQPRRQAPDRGWRCHRGDGGAGPLRAPDAQGQARANQG